LTVFALHQLVDRAAESAPEHEAVRGEGRVLTYAELLRRSDAVAAALVDAGVERGDRVALYAPKGPDTITALYGVLRAGAAYVPIDPKSPVLRAASIAADCTVSAVVSTAARIPALLEALEGHRPRVVILIGDEGDLSVPGVTTLGFEDVVRSGARAKPVPVIDTDLAYILYTSGSTGMPKGVMLTHRHALNFVEWCASVIGTGPEDRFSNHAPLHFDLSIFDLYVAAYGGATVSVVPEEWAYFGRDLARFVRQERITVWYSVPSALMVLTRGAREGETYPDLRAVAFAGEVYPTKHLRALRTLVPDADLWNLYGPTETNVCTYYRVRDVPDDDATIPIGRACENTQVFALREDGGLAGVGEPGELYVRGSAVMKGYWAQPERSAEVLVRDPLHTEAPDLVYRTGDLVRLRPDGDYDFLGRRDHQVKSRGYRIELGEVEAALNADPVLETAVAVAVPHEDWGRAIVAFVVPRDGAVVTEIEVKRRASRLLPRHMIPARVDVRSDLPRTSTGKADRGSIESEAVSRAWSWD
jgi:amino acid adenylation domain-containing protein